jgi:hypothetical protein
VVRYCAYCRRPMPLLELAEPTQRSRSMMKIRRRKAVMRDARWCASLNIERGLAFPQ